MEKILKSRNLSIYLILIGILVMNFHSLKASDREKEYLILNDSVSNINNLQISEHKFNGRQLILPAALIAVGTAGVYISSFRDLDNEVKNGMEKLRGNHYIKADDYLMLAAPAVYFGLGFTGVKSKHTFRQRLAVEITSYIAMFALTEGLKYGIREQRPDLSNRKSFPSGHTAVAFTGAELIREEYGTWWGVGAYTVATGVAFLRLYNNKHWLNDVIGGAGIGILCARIGYWMLPLYNKWFHWNERPNQPIMSISPAYDPYLKTGSINFAVVF